MTQFALEMTRRHWMKLSGAGMGVAMLPHSYAFAAKAGDFRIAVDGGSSSDTLDPKVLLSNFHGVTAFSFGNALTMIDGNGQVQPDLAESWSPSADARFWTIRLIKGVTFHNGKEVDADDVIWSLNLHRGEGNPSGAAALVKSITSIKAVTKHSLSIELESGNADLPYILSDRHLLILPKDTVDFNQAVGTGPFIRESFEPGRRYVGRANPNYFKGLPKSATLEILVMNDAIERSVALNEGVVHLMNNVDLKTLSLLKRNKRIQVLRSASGGHYTFPMQGDQAPFNNADLRKALRLSMDRKEILNKILRGYGDLGNDHPIAKNNPYFASDLPQRDYDPDQAAFHYKKSGHEGAISLSTSDGAWQGAFGAAILFKAQAQLAGITINIKQEPVENYFSNVWMQRPFCMSYWGARPTADMILSLGYYSQAPWNEGAYRNDQFDQLLQMARGELDEVKRKSYYHDMQVMLHQDGNSITPFFNDFVDAAASNVKGFVPGGFGLSGYRAAERMYIEA